MGSPAVKTWSHSTRNTETLVYFLKLTSVTWKPPALRSSLGYFWGWTYLEYQLSSIYINTTNQISSSKTNNDLSASFHPGTTVMGCRSEWKTKQDRVEMEEKGKRWGEQDKMGKFYRSGGKKWALHKFAVREIEEESARQGSEYKWADLLATSKEALRLTASPK